MPLQNDYRNIVVLSDSSDDGDERPVIQLLESEEEAEDSSDDECSSEASSFHQSDESESDSDSDFNSDHHRPKDGDGAGAGRNLSSEGEEDEDSLANRVLHLLQEGRDLGNLKLNVYKAYLRKHGLRLSGTKAECLIRIRDHWRIRDSNGEALYPRSSFSINCTGDVCKGDVVLFTQRVYQKFEKLKRSGKVLGSRTVAGRVVKESYGAAKQQHTFTVEVLWSKGKKELPPLFPLLIKGRNLYRLKTFRQPWMNEAERSKTLDEKHQRGAIARKKRGVRIQERNRHKSLQITDRGGDRNQKRHVASNHKKDGPGIHSERGKHNDQCGKGSSSANQVISICHNKGQDKHKVASNKATGARTFKPAIAQNTSINPPPFERFHGLQVQFDHTNYQNAFYRGHVPSSSSFMLPSATSNAASESRTFNPAIMHHKHTYAGHKTSTSESYHGPYQRVEWPQVQSENRNAQCLIPRGHGPGPSALGYYGGRSHHQYPGSYAYNSGCMPSAMPLPPPAFHSGAHMHQNREFFCCSRRGCKNSGSEGCVISGCLHCCRGTGMRCHVHNSQMT